MAIIVAIKHHSIMARPVLLLLLCAVSQASIRFGRLNHGNLHLAKLNRHHHGRNEVKNRLGSPVGEKWFTQRLDHFREDDRTWKQKYWVNDHFFKQYNNSHPIVFLNIGGEGPTSKFWIDEDDGPVNWLQNAKTFEALCFQIEHRYYGESYPTEDLSTENLEFLSSRQALEDIAAFIVAMNAEYNLENARWITFGGSYSGALSAWFRLKYPHLSFGAISTSGPVLAQVDFKGYLGVVQDSLNDYSKQCVDDIRAAVKEVETKKIDKADLKKRLQLCGEVDYDNKDDFANLMSTLADAFMGAVQYNHDNRGVFHDKYTIDKLCDIMVNTSASSDAVTRYGNVMAYVREVTGDASGCVDFDYTEMIEEFKNESIHSPAASSRAWVWQTCTEFGYYQSTDLPADQQPFGTSFPLDFSLQQCAAIYSDKLTKDDIFENIAETNRHYGGKDLKTLRKVVFINGSLDPWHFLGVLKTEEKSSPAIYIKGTAHCANMYPDTADDLPELADARLKITQNIAEWLMS